jgi:hypothetical protein
MQMEEGKLRWVRPASSTDFANTGQRVDKLRSRGIHACSLKRGAGRKRRNILRERCKERTVRSSGHLAGLPQYRGRTRPWRRNLHNLHFLHRLFRMCSLQFITMPTGGLWWEHLIGMAQSMGVGSYRFVEHHPPSRTP